MTFGNNNHTTVTITDYGLKSMPVITDTSVSSFSLNPPPLIRTDPSKVLGEDDYHQELFWKHFSHKNWKQQVVEAEGWGGSIMLIKLCYECQSPVFSKALLAVEDDETAKKIANRGLDAVLHHVKKSCTGALDEES